MQGLAAANENRLSMDSLFSLYQEVASIHPH
jgi:hypothetical protein